MFFALPHIYGQQFSDVTHEVGISHITYDPNQMSGGVSILDFNNDGYEDIYFIGGKYADHLYMNTGKESFIDVTTDTGLDVMKAFYTVGVVAGDLDNDGFTDLFVTTQQGQPNVCLRNLNGTSFENVAEQAGIFGTKWSTTVTLGDVDLDGDLDIYISNFVSYEGDPFFRNIIAAEPNHFMENKGPWTFGKSNLEFTGAVDGCTLVSCFTDIDDDMDPDLFVVNDFGTIYTANELFFNDGQQMQELADNYGVAEKMDGMGIAIGDVDGNGYFDYYLSNIRDCPFYLNHEGPRFTDGARYYNVNDGLGFSWGTFFADMDNDAYLDLFVAKGSISEAPDPQYNKLYRHDAEIDDFLDMSGESGLDNPHRGRGAVYADLNNDGFLDIVVNNVRIREDNQGQAMVFINQGLHDNGYVKIKLEGSISNRSAIGTQVSLHIGDHILKREVTGGSSYLSNNSYVVHFGTGTAIPDSLVIRWPSGIRQSFANLEAATYYYLKENSNLTLYDDNSTTAVESILDAASSLDFKFFPNPATDRIFLSKAIDLKSPAKVMIYNNYGQRISTHRVSSRSLQKREIDISSLLPGLYMGCISGPATSLCKKFVVTD